MTRYLVRWVPHSQLNFGIDQVRDAESPEEALAKTVNDDEWLQNIDVTRGNLFVYELDNSVASKHTVNAIDELASKHIHELYGRELREAHEW